MPVDQRLQPVFDQLVQRLQKQIADDELEPWSSQRLDQIARLYHHSPATSDLRNHLLRLLATEGSEDSLRFWGDLICEDPPLHRLGIVLAFSPLMQDSFDPPAWLLEQLLNQATSHSQIAPAVYDLLNFFYRQQRVTTHPAEERIGALSVLLGQLAGQLGKIEEGNLPPGADAAAINQVVSDSVALIVALCDCIALLDYKDGAPKLHQALELRHRRVQTEAAAALVKLGDDEGKAALIKLAEEPVTRLRVLAYAEELGLRDDISLELQGEIAIAESHLAIWLAEPAQMGLAPSDIEFIESKEMYWPSYEHPVQCYLFKYSYGKGPQAHSNIGICGPMVHAFAADLRELPIEDVYAAFAGWQTVHNEIYQIAPDRAEATFPNDWRRLVGDMHGQDYDAAEIKMAASFFGQLVLIAEATDEGKPGTAIMEANSVNWYPAGNESAPIDWQMAYAIWRGQQMLKSFNEQL